MAQAIEGIHWQIIAAARVALEQPRARQRERVEVHGGMCKLANGSQR